MTLRTRRPEGGIRTRLGRLTETDEKQQALVTVLFIVTIIAVVLILLGAVAVGWYNDNLRPLGKVGSVEISPQLMKDSIRLEQWRISRDESRITQAQIDGTLDATTAQSQLSALDTRTQNLSTTALDTLIDRIYQSQLATDEGITTSTNDIDAKYQQETSDPEQRHVLAIAVEPQAADATNGPTPSEAHAALDKATQALADLQAGKDWAEVAKQYGTDAKSQAGGDLGLITQLAISDQEFGNELFRLDQNATTGIVRGDDGVYRIGRVTEIDPGSANQALTNELLKNVTEQSAKQLMGYEVASDALQAKITNDALGQTPEQVKLAVIYVAGLFAGDTNTTDGEIDYSEIVFAPGDKLDTAPDLAPDDPAWDAAKTEADSAMAELQAITDLDQRKTKFEDTATNNSDDPTSQDAGAVGYVTRDIPPQAVSDALWSGTHQKGDLIGPIRGDAAWYVLMFNDKRGSPEDRVKAVQDALAVPGADFNAVAKELSEGPEKDDGGEIGWLTKDSLSTDIADKIWALNVGQVSDPIELGEGHYFVKVEDKQVRALDPDEIPAVRQNAFSDWYQPKKDQATTDGTIESINPTGSGADLTTGGDQGTP
jgi:parvulin-like peptidyl-prolyl isomerase